MSHPCLARESTTVESRLAAAHARTGVSAARAHILDLPPTHTSVERRERKATQPVS